MTHQNSLYTEETLKAHNEKMTKLIGQATKKWEVRNPEGKILMVILRFGDVMAKDWAILMSGDPANRLLRYYRRPRSWVWWSSEDILGSIRYSSSKYSSTSRRLAIKLIPYLQKCFDGVENDQEKA